MRIKLNIENKKLIVLICILLTIGIGIGYSVLSEQLKFNGSVNYGTMAWDVGFTETSDGGGTITSTSVLSDDKKTVSLSCDVGNSKSSETCIVKAKIKNASTFVVELESDPIITYDKTYISSVTTVWINSSTNVVAGDYLGINTEEEIQITITTKELTEDMLPSSPLSIPITVSMDWIETDGVTHDLPSYWKTYLDSKINEINAKSELYGNDADSFIFITDQHLDGSVDYAPQVINYITKKTNVKKVFFGGDTVAGSSSDDELLRQYKESFNDNAIVFGMRGNHEPDGNLTESLYYDIMIKPLISKAETSDKLYYYYDNTIQKIRYIVTDSVASKSNNLTSDEQIAWMKERILELDSDWTTVIFHHGIWEGSSVNATLSKSIDGQKIVAAVDSIYDEAQCTIAAIYSGHTHRDYYDFSQKGYALISTTTDSTNNNFSKADIINPVRVEGTTSEQTFDVVFINPANREFDAIRIGVGDNRILSFYKSDLQDDIEGINITSNFTWNNGAVMYSTGEVDSTSASNIKDWLYSNLVDVSEYNSITFSHIQTTNQTTTLGYAFYDENENYISGASNSGVSYDTVRKTIAVPEGAKYFRVMWMNVTHSRYNETTYGINNFYCYGSTNSLEAVQLNITNNFTWNNGAVMYSTGEVDSTSASNTKDWLYSNLVDVSEYNSITFSHIQTTNQTTTLGYAFYDENENYISGASNSGVSYVTVRKTIAVPEGAKYFRVMWMNATHSRYNETTYGIDKFYCYGNINN